MRALLLALLLASVAWAQEEGCPAPKSPTVITLTTKTNPEQGTLEARARLAALDAVRRMLIPLPQRTIYFQRCASSCGDPTLYRFCANLTGCCYADPDEAQCPAGTHKCSKGVGCCEDAYSATPWIKKIAGACPAGSAPCPPSTAICCNASGAFKGAYPNGCPPGTSFENCAFCCQTREIEVDVPVEDCGFVGQRACGLDELSCRTGCCLPGETPISQITDEKGYAFVSYALPGQGESFEVVAFFKGDNLFQPSNSSSGLTGGIPPLFTLTQCFPLILIVSFLVAAMFASGRNPFGVLDLTARVSPPRVRLRGPQAMMISTASIAALIQSGIAVAAAARVNRSERGRELNNTIKELKTKIKNAKNTQEVITLKKQLDVAIKQREQLFQQEQEAIGKKFSPLMLMLSGRWSSYQGKPFGKLRGQFARMLRDEKGKYTWFAKYTPFGWGMVAVEQTAKYSRKAVRYAALYTNPAYLAGAITGRVRLVRGARGPLTRAEVARKIPIVGPAAGWIVKTLDTWEAKYAEFAKEKAAGPLWLHALAYGLSAINQSLVLLKLGRAQLLMHTGMRDSGIAPATGSFMAGLNDAITSKLDKMEAELNRLRAENPDDPRIPALEEAIVFARLERTIKEQPGSKEYQKKADEAKEKLEKLAKKLGISLKFITEGPLAGHIDREALEKDMKEKNVMKREQDEVLALCETFNDNFWNAKLTREAEEDANRLMADIKDAYSKMSSAREQLFELAAKHGFQVSFEDGSIKLAEVPKDVVEKANALVSDYNNNKEAVKSGLEKLNAAKGIGEALDLVKAEAEYRLARDRLDAAEKNYEKQLAILSKKEREAFENAYADVVDYAIKNNIKLQYNADGTIIFEGESPPPEIKKFNELALSMEAAAKANLELVNAQENLEAKKDAFERASALPSAISGMPYLQAAIEIGDFLFKKNGTAIEKSYKEWKELDEKVDETSGRINKLKDLIQKYEHEIEEAERKLIEKYGGKYEDKFKYEISLPEDYLAYKEKVRRLNAVKEELNELEGKIALLQNQANLARSSLGGWEANQRDFMDSNDASAYVLGGKLFSLGVLSTEEQREALFKAAHDSASEERITGELRSLEEKVLAGFGSADAGVEAMKTVSGKEEGLDKLLANYRNAYFAHVQLPGDLKEQIKVHIKALEMLSSTADVIKNDIADSSRSDKEITLRRIGVIKDDIDEIIEGMKQLQESSSPSPQS
ncbi:MAG: hypothetical protein QXG98_01795 [Candidatus Micrarchaeia archaeon]